jgi:FemAB-related protein (PEP-CTERM system-associated)
MRIRFYENADRQRWNAFVEGHPQGTPFHRIAWKDVVERAFGHRSVYLLAEEGGAVARPGRIVGVLPLFEIRSVLFGRYLVSVPFAELGGPLAQDVGTAQALVDQAAALCRREGLDYLELRNREPLDGYPVKTLYANFSRALAPNPDDNLKAIPRKSRRMVRVGMKAGLRSDTGHQWLDTFYDILAANYHRLGTPIFPKKFFRHFLAAFGRHADILVVRTAEGRPVAAVLSFFFRDTVMPYYAGSLVEYRALAPNDFMYWELMRRSCLAGYRRFDFGRSKKGSGSYAFKVHWGFEPKPLAYQYVLHRMATMPDLSPANPAYQWKIALWRKLPGWAARLLGPPVARYLA